VGILRVIEMQKNNKFLIAMGSSIVATMVGAVGYCIIKKNYDRQNLKIDMAGIPWDFEGSEAYR